LTENRLSQFGHRVHSRSSASSADSTIELSTGIDTPVGWSQFGHGVISLVMLIGVWSATNSSVCDSLSSDFVISVASTVAERALLIRPRNDHAKRTRGTGCSSGVPGPNGPLMNGAERKVCNRVP